jgi:ribosomal protein S18 acetylase RimI-like enzyme
MTYVQKSKVYKLGALLALVFAMSGLIYYACTPTKTIVDFEYARDAQEVRTLFQRDWYWLVACPPQEYDLDLVLRYRAIHQNLNSAGTLTMKVVRECDNFKGFVAYYKKGPHIGFILFLSVKTDERKRGYGKILAQYAVDDLLAQGCTTIEIVTRPSNEAALHLYKKLGFKEISRDSMFVELALTK